MAAMRVAIITESFSPDVNGVANSVARVADHLLARGHQPLVISPKPSPRASRAITDKPYPVVRLGSLPMPGYGNVRLAWPTRRIREALAGHRADVVHLASPFVLGAWGAKAAAELGVPVVAIYQTDVPGYARAYKVATGEALAWRWIRHVHGRAEATLAPSSTTAAELVAHGVPNVGRWGRGVDTELFHPSRRDEALRAELAPGGELIVGYVGRLAREKRVDLLAQTAARPGVRVVVVGDGPTRDAVRRAVPQADFLGTRRGTDLARLYASLDVFVHTGPHETFCQTVQEAQASGVPVVAPAIGGPLDLVHHGVDGLLVTPDDGAAFAAAVDALADPAVRRAYGQAARAAVSTRTWSALGDELIGHYAAAAVRAPGRLPAPVAVPVRVP
ncbi:glycosyltransferase family 1 protein [Catellatospora chokoriensis]|uniref:GDP-mannose-dependent alpha-mannosyltransferase n=2 Tax=Catellatospora chokoriensis TaxID=310353 RepID=A0A8J3K529_9ACTN|nr:GDP-mannose-dependent alpha-mannosyltransferase [Catellatospora chokoriensis]